MTQKFFRIVLLLPALSLAGCGTILTDIEAYGGAPKSQSDAALLSEERVSDSALVYVSRDGTLFYDRTQSPIQTRVRLRLAPGQYLIYAKAGGFKTSAVDLLENLDLKAGHSYVVKAMDCFLLLGCGWGNNSQDRATYLWIEDETVHEIVAGSPSEAHPVSPQT